MNSLTASRRHIKAYRDASNKPLSEYTDEFICYALMLQWDAVNEFILGQLVAV